MTDVTESQVHGQLSARAGRTDGRPPADAERGDGLLSRVEAIEAQPLEQRADGFDRIADEMLAELQRSDHEGVQ